MAPFLRRAREHEIDVFAKRTWKIVIAHLDHRDHGVARQYMSAHAGQHDLHTRGAQSGQGLHPVGRLRLHDVKPRYLHGFAVAQGGAGTLFLQTLPERGMIEQRGIIRNDDRAAAFHHVMDQSRQRAGQVGGDGFVGGQSQPEPGKSAFTGVRSFTSVQDIDKPGFDAIQDFIYTAVHLHAGPSIVTRIEPPLDQLLPVEIVVRALATMLKEQGDCRHRVRQVAGHGAYVHLFRHTSRCAAPLGMHQGDEPGYTGVAANTILGKPFRCHACDLSRAQAGGQDKADPVGGEGTVHFVHGQFDRNGR